MPITLLNSVENRAEWHDLLHRMPSGHCDVYFQPEYLDLHKLDPAAQSLAFVYRRHEAAWLYPFLLRPINILSASPCWYDIESQYGYGGPLSNCPDADFIKEAGEAFVDWCASQQIVAEFVRFHPLLDNWRFLPAIEAIHDRATVSLDFAAISQDSLPYDSKTNNMLRRSADSGLTCVISSTASSYQAFVELYKATMLRLEANSFYYFNDHYFNELYELVTKNGFMVSADLEGEIIAGALFLKGDKYLHYHLSATDSSKRVPGCMNLILHTAALHGKKMLLEKMHLGGGRTNAPDDSLLKFKKTMATDCHTFYFGKRIHNAAVYDQVSEKWRKDFPHLASKYSSQLLCYHNLA